jgi:hypothetical protein
MLLRVLALGLTMPTNTAADTDSSKYASSCHSRVASIEGHRIEYSSMRTLEEKRLDAPTEVGSTKLRNRGNDKSSYDGLEGCTTSRVHASV